MAVKPGLALDDPVLEIADAHQMTVRHMPVRWTLRSPGLMHE
jgi:hypothetical protein